MIFFFSCIIWRNTYSRNQSHHIRCLQQGLSNEDEFLFETCFWSPVKVNLMVVNCSVVAIYLILVDLCPCRTCRTISKYSFDRWYSKESFQKFKQSQEFRIKLEKSSFCQVSASVMLEGIFSKLYLIILFILSLGFIRNLSC